MKNGGKAKRKAINRLIEETKLYKAAKISLEKACIEKELDVKTCIDLAEFGGNMENIPDVARTVVYYKRMMVHSVQDLIDKFDMKIEEINRDIWNPILGLEK